MAYFLGFSFNSMSRQHHDVWALQFYFHDVWALQFHFLNTIYDTLPSSESYGHISWNLAQVQQQPLPCLLQFLSSVTGG